MEAMGGTSVWPWLLPLLAVLYLLFEICRGWRRGVVRHGVSVIALLIAGGVGWVFAWMTGPISDHIVPWTPPAGRMIFGFAAALAFYLAAVVLSSVLFKKTSQQSSGLVRLIYGAGGAFFGLIFGLVVLWGAVTLFRATEALVAGMIPGAPAQAVSAGDGVTARLMDRVDIVPSDTYVLLSKFMQVTRSPAAMERFLAYPGTQELMANSKLGELFTDPGVTEAAGSGNIFLMLSNAKVLEIASDPGVHEAASKFDLEKALDYALQTPPTSPSP